MHNVLNNFYEFLMNAKKNHGQIKLIIIIINLLIPKNVFTGLTLAKCDFQVHKDS